MRLWDWALAAWEQPGVTEACLDLQNRHGQCIALLLWRLWALRRPLGQDGLIRAIAEARPFERDVLRPLRAARRALGEGDLKAQVRAVELAAERALFESLEGVTPAGDECCHIDADAALAALMESWNQAGPEAADGAARLAAALPI